MPTLDTLIPDPRLVEVDGVEVTASPETAWQAVRHEDLGRSALVRALFAARTLPGRFTGREPEPSSMRIDDITQADRPGFRLLAEEPGRELAVGAIGKVWEPDIPFVDVADAAGYAAFGEPGWVKVAWALRVEPRHGQGARISLEVRLDATDDRSWRRFRRYFRLIGPGSHLVRRQVLAGLERELGGLDATEDVRALPGDDLLADAAAQVTHGQTIRAAPADIWPWLLQLGCGRGGFYSLDLLDNAGAPSAREIHPELQALTVGDRIPATPGGPDGFEVLRIEPERALVLGGLFDGDADDDAGRRLPFASPRPDRYWHVTWAFVLEPLDEATTRLHVRARAAFPSRGRLHAEWIRPVHHLMQTAQLRHLAARAERRLPRDSWRDIAKGTVGAAGMVLDLLTPFLRPARSHWGLDPETVSGRFPGDSLIPEPSWGWTHGIEVDAPPEEVWPWVVQIGADRAGFYSHQWLENLAGCNLRNAETLHPEWTHEVGSTLVLHPAMPGLAVVELVPQQYLLAHAGDDRRERPAGAPSTEVTWLFSLEPLEEGRTRLVSRFRSSYPEGRAQHAALPYLTEAIGFVMDRQMLVGIKERVLQHRIRALSGR